MAQLRDPVIFWCVVGIKINLDWTDLKSFSHLAVMIKSNMSCLMDVRLSLLSCVSVFLFFVKQRFNSYWHLPYYISHKSSSSIYNNSQKTNLMFSNFLRVFHQIINLFAFQHVILQRHQQSNNQQKGQQPTAHTGSPCSSTTGVNLPFPFLRDSPLCYMPRQCSDRCFSVQQSAASQHGRSNGVIKKVPVNGMLGREG